MNSLQRAWRCVIRKPVKSILLLLVILAISLFLLAGMASKGASIETQDQTRQAVGASLRLEENEANRHVRMMELSEELGEKEGSNNGYHQEKIDSPYGETWYVWTDNFFETLLLEDIEKLGKVPGVASYNITTVATPVNPVNFTRIEDPDKDQYVDQGGVTLIGNRDMEWDGNVATGNVFILEGRMVTSKDENTCVISKELAEQNRYIIGDKLEFNNYRDIENATIYEGEIIGIYDTKQKMTPIMSGDTYRSENIIFTDLHFPEKAEGCENDPLFKYATFQVEDVNQYEEVKESLKQVDIDWERYDLIDNNGNLETMSSNFKELEKISGFLIGIVVAASFVILFLIFMFWIRSRIQEVGIFLAMGIEKRSILGQLFLEALIVGGIGFILSFAVAPTVSEITANYLVSQQVEQEEIKKSMDERNVGTDYIEPEHVVTGVHIKITTNMIAVTGISIIVLIGSSILIAGIAILRKSPKDILSELS